MKKSDQYQELPEELQNLVDLALSDYDELSTPHMMHAFTGELHDEDVDAMTALVEECLSITLYNLDDGDGNREIAGELDVWLDDLALHGAISGMVSGLIYYSETGWFFERHKRAISMLVRVTSHDLHPKRQPARYGDWCTMDPLAATQPNQNVLAWWAFDWIVGPGMAPAELLKRAAKMLQAEKEGGE